MQLPNNAISAVDAARIVGISPKHLREILRESKLKGVKIKKQWYVDLDSLKEYVNRNGSRLSNEIEINGEHAVKLSIFAEKRGIASIKDIVKNPLYNVHKVNKTYYITDSEARRYDKRFEEYYGRKIIPIMQVAKCFGCSVEWIYERVSENELEIVRFACRVFVFADSLEKLNERLQAGNDFLSIPKGKIRRAEAIERLTERIEEERNDT